MKHYVEHPGIYVITLYPREGNAADSTAMQVGKNPNCSGGFPMVSKLNTVAGLVLAALFTAAGLMASEPVSMTIAAGNNQAAPPSGGFATPLQVTVVDGSSVPAAGVSVTFAINPGANGAGGSFGGSATVLTDNTGTATAPTLTANGTTGKFTVVATAGSLTQTFHLVVGAATAISLTAPVTTSILSQNVTFTATVTGNSPNGNVTFFDGSNVLGYEKVTGGVAALSTRFLPAGPNSITAIYDGDAANAPSAVSGAKTVTVTAYARSDYRSSLAGAPAFYGSGAKGDFVLVVDVNGDGVADVVQLSDWTSSFTTFLGKGDGTFAATAPASPGNGACTTPAGAGSAVTCDAGGLPVFAAAGDFNGDGKPDL